MPIGRRTGFEANAAAAPINATPARAFNATALTDKHNHNISFANLSIDLKYRGKKCLWHRTFLVSDKVCSLLLNDKMLTIDTR